MYLKSLEARACFSKFFPFPTLASLPHRSISLPQTWLLSDMEYSFYQLAYQDSKIPKCFVGLIQMQCSPSFDSNWCKQNDPTTCCHQAVAGDTSYTHDFRFYSKGNVSTTQQIAWVGSLNPPPVPLHGLRPLPAPINMGTPPLKSPVLDI